MRRRNAGLSRWPSRGRSRDHSPSAPISAMPFFVRRVRPVPAGDGDAVAVNDEVLDPRAELQHDVGVCPHRFEQRRLQVAAMDDPIGRAVARLGIIAERDAGQICPRAARISTASGATALARSRCSRPSPIRMRVALGESWMPAPVSSSVEACSSTTARKPRCAKASAAVSPPIPAPAMMMLREGAKGMRPGDQAASGRAQSGGRAVCGSSVGSWR